MGLDNAACRWAAPARYPWVLVTIPSSVKGDRKTYHWVVATRRSSRPRGPPTLPPPFIAAVGPDDPSASVRRWRIWVLLTHERLGFGYVDAELFFVNPEVFDVLQHCDYFVSAEFRAKSWHRALESRHAGVLKAGAALAHYLVKETVRVVPRMSFSVEGRWRQYPLVGRDVPIRLASTVRPVAYSTVGGEYATPRGLAGVGDDSDPHFVGLLSTFGTCHKQGQNKNQRRESSRPCGGVDSCEGRSGRHPLDTHQWFPINANVLTSGTPPEFRHSLPAVGRWLPGTTAAGLADNHIVDRQRCQRCWRRG